MLFNYYKPIEYVAYRAFKMHLTNLNGEILITITSTCTYTKIYANKCTILNITFLLQG